MNNNGILRGFFMKTKKILSLLLSVSLLAMSFVGCGKTKTNVDDDEMKTIAIIAKGESHAFWQSVKQGAEDAAKKHGGYKITFRGPASETSAELPAQKEMAQTAIINNPDGLIIATIGEGFTDVLEQAYDKKIPVVQFDSGVWEADINALNEKGKIDSNVIDGIKVNKDEEKDKGQIIYSGNVSKKGVHTNNTELAAQEAYSEASKEIAIQVKEIINN